MSYPAEPGSVRGVFRTDRDVPSLAIGATTARFVATGNVTGGEFGLYRWEMSAASGGAGGHFHRTFSESFYILSGAVRLYDGAGWTEAGAGDFLHVPVSGVHGFANESGAPASMLILFCPGAPRESYFEELAERIASGLDLGPEERAAFLARHDQYMV
jgi:quercetin dioxygenase-like cupin family protein